MTTWQWSSFEGLSRDDLYAVIERRQEVFIIEQQCIYPDIDGIDHKAFHLLGWGEQDGERQLLAFYAVFFPA